MSDVRVISRMVFGLAHVYLNLSDEIAERHDAHLRRVAEVRRVLPIAALCKGPTMCQEIVDEGNAHLNFVMRIHEHHTARNRIVLAGKTMDRVELGIAQGGRLALLFFLPLRSCRR